MGPNPTIPPTNAPRSSEPGIPSCTAPQPTASSTTPRTSPRRTSSAPPVRVSTRSNSSSGSQRRRWARARESSRPSTPSPCWPRPGTNHRRGWHHRVASAVRTDLVGGTAGRINEPTRVSVLQPWHEANGATPILAGQWVRPEHYGDPPPRCATRAPTSASSTSRRSANSTCRP